MLGVLGGSLGAKVLNEVTERVADAHDEGEISIVHLTGHAHYDSVSEVAAGSAQSGRCWPSKTTWSLSTRPAT